MTAVLRNDVQMGCLRRYGSRRTSLPGQVKILAISLGQRLCLCPASPTLREAGIDVEADAWNGLIAPAPTPEPIIAKIHDLVVEALAERRSAPIAAAHRGPFQLAGAISRQDQRRSRAWVAVIKALDLKIN